MSAPMPVNLFPRLSLWIAFLTCLALAGCESLPDKTKVISTLSPYKADIVQGNVVTREQVALIRPGMPRTTVRDVLGSPLLTSLFHAQRWDYVFTFRRQGAAEQTRHVTVQFKDDLVDAVDADDLPSEAEFASTLKSPIELGQQPALVADEEQLKKFPSPAKVANPVPAAPSAPAATTKYPPLESTGN